MGFVGLPELVIVAALALLVVGSSRLPSLGRAAGEASKQYRGLKKTLDETKDEVAASFKDDADR